MYKIEKIIINENQELTWLKKKAMIRKNKRDITDQKEKERRKKIKTILVSVAVLM